jgi:hypothetical protein
MPLTTLYDANSQVLEHDGFLLGRAGPSPDYISPSRDLSRIPVLSTKSPLHGESAKLSHALSPPPTLCCLVSLQGNYIQPSNISSSASTSVCFSLDTRLPAVGPHDAHRTRPRWQALAFFSLHLSRLTYAREHVSIHLRAGQQSRVEPVLQRDHEPQRLGEELHPRRTLFRARAHKHALRTDAAPSPLFRPLLRARYSPTIITRHVFTSLLPYPQFLCCVGGD